MLRQQVLVNHASSLHPGVVAAHQAKGVERFERASRQFLQMIRDIDQLLATRQEFLLGHGRDKGQGCLVLM